jgi:hypothetical protein
VRFRASQQERVVWLRSERVRALASWRHELIEDSTSDER